MPTAMTIAMGRVKATKIKAKEKVVKKEKVGRAAKERRTQTSNQILKTEERKRKKDKENGEQKENKNKNIFIAALLAFSAACGIFLAAKRGTS